MQKLKLTALILISIATLSGCSKTESTAMTEPAGQSQQIASKSPEGDIYAMEYKLCGKVCEPNTSGIITWGKPTEIGIGYYDDFIGKSSRNLISSINKRQIMKTYLMVKCRGTLPGVEKPIAEDRFIPVETYPGILVEAADINPTRPAKYGHIEIIAIKKIPINPGDNPSKIAISALKTRLNGIYVVKPTTVEGYVWATDKKPDAQPQQVEPITWQEGQPPQVIPVKAW